MASKHMNLKRVTKRVKEEFGSTIEIAKVLNIKLIFNLWFIMDIKNGDG